MSSLPKKVKMKKIAITGTIGSGKTECSHIIEDLGYSVFNCDKEVNEFYVQNHPALQPLKDIFPSSYQNGQWDKIKIATEIFKSPEKKQLLENIIYPLLLDKMQSLMKQEKDVFFAEVPLLFQTGWDQYFDQTLVITCDDEIAIERLIKHRGLSEEDARLRLSHQKKSLEQIERASKIIYNNDNLNSFKKQIVDWLEGEDIIHGTKR